VGDVYRGEIVQPSPDDRPDACIYITAQFCFWHCCR
jgi:hypothetical protein